MKKYDELMNKIEVTPEMRARILQNIQSSAPPKRPILRVLKRYGAIAACFALILCGAVLLSGQPDLSEPSESDVLIANPMQEYESAQELSDAAGFPVQEPETLPFKPKETVYALISQQIAQITYQSGEQTLTYRKSIGSNDNSGYFSDFSKQTTVAANQTKITVQGEENGYLLAVWQKDGYSYSISVSVPMTQAEWEMVLQSLPDTK